MESLILSNQSLKNFDMVDVEIRTKAKSLLYMDLSNNYLEYIMK